ncbi:MAG: hypothetical protein AB1942_14985 [Pseudomonadota bacterium]
MTFWGAARDGYRWSAGMLRALPWLAVLIVALEGLQHLVEWRTGMYVSLAAAKAGEHDPARMMAGLAKVAWLLVLHYWAARFIVSGGSVTATFGRDRVAVRRFAVYFAFSLALAVTQLWLPVWMRTAGADNARIVAVSLALMLGGLPLGVALSPWSTGAAIGDPAAGPLMALRRAGGSIFWGLGLTLVVILPVMAAHYVLALAPIGRPPLVAGALLAADSVLVGFLGVLVNTVPVLIAMRMARRRGEPLSLCAAD